MRLIEVRQPREHDVIGRRFPIAGFGSGFEATVLWRVLGEDGDALAEGLVQGVGSNGVIQDFGQEVRLPASVSARGAHVDPAGLRGRRLRREPTGHRSQRGPRHPVHRPAGLAAARGDPRRHPLGDRAGRRGEHDASSDVFEANRDILTDPDEIVPGQVLRVPLL